MDRCHKPHKKPHKSERLHRKRVVISVYNGTPTQVLSVPQNMRGKVSLNVASATDTCQNPEPPSKIERGHYTEM